MVEDSLRFTVKSQCWFAPLLDQWTGGGSVPSGSRSYLVVVLVTMMQFDNGEHIFQQLLE